MELFRIFINNEQRTNNIYVLHLPRKIQGSYGETFLIPVRQSDPKPDVHRSEDVANEKVTFRQGYVP